LGSDICSYNTIEHAKIKITAKHFFQTTMDEECWFVQRTGPALVCNGGIGSLVLPLEAQCGKKLTKTLPYLIVKVIKPRRMTWRAIKGE
jgi:hypothetical protein